MVVKIYVNADENIAVNEENFEKNRKKEIQRIFDEKKDFEDWLNDSYSASEVWDIFEQERKQILDSYWEHCVDEWEDNFYDNWNPYEVEI